MSGNFTNATTISLSKGLYVALADVLTITALFGYITIIWIIVKYKKTIFRNSFYTLILSMGVADLVLLTSDLVYLTPAVLYGEAIMPPWFSLGAGFLNLWAIHSSIAHMVAISINRLAAVVLSQTYQTYFTDTKLAMIIGFCQVHSLTTALIIYLCKCVVKLEGYTWKFFCSDSGHGFFAMTYVQMMCLLGFIITVGVYIAILILMRRKNQNTWDEQRRGQIRKEKSLVLQFGLVVLAYTVYIATFWLEYFLADKFPKGDGQAVLWLTAILHSGLNPFLYMTFGSEIKKVIFKRQVMPVSTPAPARNNAYMQQ